MSFISISALQWFSFGGIALPTGRATLEILFIPTIPAKPLLLCLPAFPRNVNFNRAFTFGYFASPTGQLGDEIQRPALNTLPARSPVLVWAWQRILSLLLQDVK